VSNSDDNQDYPKTLPSPELNPLTNPVLGRNMGRWAEVYFTSPPEKREQAVQELLRELERDSSAGESSAQVTAVPSEPGNAAEEDRTRLSKNSSANLPATFSPNFSENPPRLPLRQIRSSPQQLPKKLSRYLPGFRRPCGRNLSNAIRAANCGWWNKNSAGLAGMRCRCERVCWMQLCGMGTARKHLQLRRRGSWNSRRRRITWSQIA